MLPVMLSSEVMPDDAPLLVMGLVTVNSDHFAKLEVPQIHLIVKSDGVPV
jgi:hypothetical protein